MGNDIGKWIDDMIGFGGNSPPPWCIMKRKVQLLWMV